MQGACEPIPPVGTTSPGPPGDRQAMAIQFLCPNGHPIRCPDEQAGRAAKCPKCGVKFRIPELSDLEAAPEAEEGAKAGGGDAGRVHGVSAQNEIEFLCPNGHRLHGPASLQGRPGQCPECGSKFRIPSYEDVPDEGEETTGQEQIVVGRLGGGDDSGVELETAEAPECPDSAEELELVLDAGYGLPALFSRLWARKSQGAVVELHLAGGEKVVPDRFSTASAGGSHGLFAIAEKDGTYTLVGVAWDAVTRVVVRKIKDLPPELRE